MPSSTRIAIRDKTTIIASSMGDEFETHEMKFETSICDFKNCGI
jgi:hypothetical protein